MGQVPRALAWQDFFRNGKKEIAYNFYESLAF